MAVTRRDLNLRGLEPVLATALDAVVIIDSTGLVRGWNRLAHETFGWTSEEALGRSLVDLIIPEQHRAAHSSGMARYQATGVAHVLNRRIEITALKKTGEEIPVELSITVASSGPEALFIGYLRDISERRQIEDSLRSSEAAAHQQAAILAQLAEGVIVANAAGQLTFVNESAARLHGVAELGVEPDQYSDTYHLFTEEGAPYPPSELPLARALRGETVEEARWKVERPDGTSVLAVGSARPVKDAAGMQVGAVLTVRDDTRRDAAERQVRENEARLRALTDNLPGGMVYQIRTGLDGSERQFLYVSQSHEQLTGVPAEAVLEDPSIPYSLIHPDDRAQMVEAEAASIRDRKSFDVQLRFRRADGEERWCRIISAPREQPDGSLIWDGLQIDITARIAAEVALRELNARLEERVAERTAERNLLATLIETTDVMVMACDLEYRILALNKANADEFERVYGIRPKVGDGLLDLLADQPEHQREVRDGWARALGGQEITVVEDFGDRNRARPYYAISFRSLRDSKGGLFGAYQFVTDVSDRLRAEAQLIEAQEALRQSQKMEAMGQLTGGVAHDFNNLLTPIIGSLDMLQRRGVGGEREQRLIGGALQSAERAKTLVQRLLAFARRQPLQTTAVDVAKLIIEMSDLLAATSGPQVEIVVNAPDELKPAAADLNQLEMAILNLAVNARDAMPAGGTLTLSAAYDHVSVGSRGELKPGAYICLSVADTGIGMDEATLKRAAEPFFSTKGVGKGTGLGLSMVHGLASQLGGAMRLTSSPGGGTEVKLWLPTSDLEPQHDIQANAAEVPGRRSGTVLLVDDEEAVRLSAADMLLEIGYEVVEARTAAEALELLANGLQPELIVTDHLMPGMTGTDLIEKVREKWPSIRTLLISGFAETEGIAPDLPRLSKPFRQADLIAAISALGPEFVAQIRAEDSSDA